MFIPFDEQSELYHHGILGMHWGIRRYQPYPSGEKKGKEVGAALKVKQRPKKRKLSKDAKMRAKMRNEIKNAQVRAELERAKAEEAEARKRTAPEKAQEITSDKYRSKIERANEKQKAYEAKSAKEKAKAEYAKQKQAAKEARLDERAAKREAQARHNVSARPLRGEYGKQKAIMSGDPKKVRKYARYMTSDEFKAAVERCRAANDLKIQEAELLSKWGEKFANGLSKMADVSTSVIKIHDNIATVHNAMDKGSKSPWAIWNEDKAAKARAAEEYRWKKEDRERQIRETERKGKAERMKTIVEKGYDPVSGKSIFDEDFSKSVPGLNRQQLESLFTKHFSKGGKGKQSEEDIEEIVERILRRQ